MCALHASNSLVIKGQLESYANTIVDASLQDLEDVWPLPDHTDVVPEVVDGKIVSETVRLTNGKLRGLKSSTRDGSCVALTSTLIECPIEANDVTASYDNYESVRGSVHFKLHLTLDSDQHLIGVETLDIVFDENKEEIKNLFSLGNNFETIGHKIKNVVKKHAGQIAGTVLGTVVTAKTGKKALGEIAGKLTEIGVDLLVNGEHKA